MSPSSTRRIPTRGSMRRVMSRLGLSLLWIFVAAAPNAASAAERSFAVIVGQNASVDASVKPLRYADDDAARFYELFRPIADQVHLLAVLDAETQRVHKTLASVARAPSRENLKFALAQVNQQMQAARAAGDVPVLYFVYVGHGHVSESGQGYVSLLDGPLTGEQLWTDVVAGSSAEFNHLILDACNSYLMVARRGASDAKDDSGPDASAAIRSYLEAQRVGRFPNTGLIVSTSQAKETHEWSVFRGGVFSHEVRSALSGAADSNGDGRIEYSEIEAFLAAANLAVDDPRARIEAFIQAPSIDHNRPAVDLAHSRFKHFVRIPSAIAGRLYLEDDRGVRYADTHKTSENETVVALVDSSRYFLRSGDGEIEMQLGQPGTLDLSSSKFTTPNQSARGSVSDAFREHLFEIPYGPGFYKGFVARTQAVTARKVERSYPPPTATPSILSLPLKNPYE